MRGRFPPLALATLLVRPTVDVPTCDNVSDEFTPSAKSALECLASDFPAIPASTFGTKCRAFGFRYIQAMASRGRTATALLRRLNEDQASVISRRRIPNEPCLARFRSSPEPLDYLGKRSDLTPAPRGPLHYPTPRAPQTDRFAAARRAKVPNTDILAGLGRPLRISRSSCKHATKHSRVSACSPRCAALPGQSLARL